MTTPDVTDPYAQLGAVNTNPVFPGMGVLPMMQMRPMDPMTAQFQSQMMMPHMLMQQQMLAMQAAQMSSTFHMNPAMHMNPAAHMMAAQGIADSTGFNSKGLPIRAGVQPCQFFLKTGDCKFGPQCKWDHNEIHDPTSPMFSGIRPPITPAMAAGVPNNGENNSLGYPLRPEQQACSFFSKTGTCSFGAACKWDHPESFCHLAMNNPGGPPPIPNPANKDPPIGYNSLGYPLRPGQPPCSFYTKTGTCSFALNCRWDHPEDMAGTEPTYQKAFAPFPGVPPRAGPY